MHHSAESGNCYVFNVIPLVVNTQFMKDELAVDVR